MRLNPEDIPCEYTLSVGVARGVFRGELLRLGGVSRVFFHTSQARALCLSLAMLQRKSYAQCEPVRREPFDIGRFCEDYLTPTWVKASAHLGVWGNPHLLCRAWMTIPGFRIQDLIFISKEQVNDMNRKRMEMRSSLDEAVHKRLAEQVILSARFRRLRAKVVLTDLDEEDAVQTRIALKRLKEQVSKEVQDAQGALGEFYRHQNLVASMLLNARYTAGSRDLT